MRGTEVQDRKHIHKDGVAPMIRSLEVSASVQIVLLPRTHYEASYVTDCDQVGFAFETQVGEHAFASDRKSPFRTHPNSLSYIPPGCDVYSHSPSGGEYLLVRLRGDRPLGTRRFNDLVHTGAGAASCSLRRILLSGNPAPELDVENCVSMLLSATAQVLTGDFTIPAAARWMTRRRLRIVDELIDAELHSRLTVASMAAKLELSPEFFIRTFKAAVGMTPHAYVMERRVGRARALLQYSLLTLAGIAAECGFASQAHMATTFRNRLGIRPSALRTR